MWAILKSKMAANLVSEPDPIGFLDPENRRIATVTHSTPLSVFEILKKLFLDGDRLEIQDIRHQGNRKVWSMCFLVPTHVGLAAGMNSLSALASEILMK